MFQKERLQDIKDLFYFLEKKINKNIVWFLFSQILQLQ